MSDIKAKKILKDIASADVDFEKVLAVLERLSGFKDCYVTGSWAKDQMYNYFYVKCTQSTQTPYSIYLGRSVKLVELYAMLRQIAKLADSILEDFRDLVNMYKEFKSKVSDL